MVPAPHQAPGAWQCATGIFMVQEMSSMLASLCSFVLVLCLLGNKTHFPYCVGRLSLVPVARLCDPSHWAGDVVPSTTHTLEALCTPCLLHLVVINSRSGPLFPL